MIIELKNGALYITRRKIQYKTYKELNRIKQVWRDCYRWESGRNLFEVAEMLGM